jgi:hypothetical protein
VYPDGVTLAVVFKGPEGLALAVDSRATLTVQLANGEKMTSYYDNATKLLSVQGQKYVGIVTYGMAAIGTTEPRMPNGFMPEFEAELGRKHGERATVAEVARELGSFFTQQWQKASMPAPAGDIPPMVFLVAGFDKDEPYGHVYRVSVPDAPDPEEQNAGSFGLTWGGQREFVDRVLQGIDFRAVDVVKDELKLTDAQADSLKQRLAREFVLPIPWQFLPLQDGVDLSAFLVNMTSGIQAWTLSIRGVGGAVDVATVTRTEGFQAIKKKAIHV